MMNWDQNSEVESVRRWLSRQSWLQHLVEDLVWLKVFLNYGYFCVLMPLCNLVLWSHHTHFHRQSVLHLWNLLSISMRPLFSIQDASCSRWPVHVSAWTLLPKVSKSKQSRITFFNSLKPSVMEPNKPETLHGKHGCATKGVREGMTFRCQTWI